MGMKITGCHNYKNDNKRAKKRPHETNEMQFDGREDMRINVFIIIIDTLVTELTKRKNAYDKICNLFGFLEKIVVIPDEEIRKKALELRDIYTKDFDDYFPDECLQYKYFLIRSGHNDTLNLKELLENIKTDKLMATFPNIDVILRIYLCLPSTNASGERSFSTLRRIKNYLRNALSDDKTSDLALLNVSQDILNSVCEEEIINRFISLKQRKKF